MPDLTSVLKPSEHLELLRDTDGDVAMATLVETRRSASLRPGSKMWVGPGRRVIGAGTIGGCVDERVIGARSPAEIALSVPAEALAIRNGRTGGSLRGGAG